RTARARTVNLYPENEDELFKEIEELHCALENCLAGNLSPSLSLPDKKTIGLVWDLLSSGFNFEVLWSDAAAIGFAYQIFGSALRQRALDRIQSANKQHSLDHLISFTQLYTPTWVVDFLLANTLLPLLDLSNPKVKFKYWLLDQATKSILVDK